ncbi:glycosyl transferase family 1 [Pseudoalteromonas phenolica]|uniref:Glycosyl transferase family 1 n=1 Tax=Pseudoalteromonas phenolica TaxID=161398 RepID=A0A5R9PYZ3_9GAMM|nr:glycosyltransferase [Pseudoalteromonas phenolica]TLX45357.1 glycosyl transferase family 1 [Pseudoalteromonas phenolica]
MNNLHISLTEMKNESRVLKQTSSIYSSESFENVFVASLWGESLALEEDLDGINLKRFDLKTRNFGNNLVVQLLKYFEFGLSIFSRYRKESIGIITIHSLALLPIGVILKFLYGAKLIYDAHELETEKNGLHGIRKILSKKVEKLLIRFVDHTVVVSKSIERWYKKHYPNSKVTVVFNAPIVKNVQKTTLLRDRFDIQPDTKLYIYQGGLKPGSGVEQILEVFKKTKKNVAVVFMGYGVSEGDIIESSKEHENIYYLPAVAPSEVLSYTSSADIGLSFVEAVCLSYSYCMPNKVFEYLASGLPVIVSDCIDMKSFIQEHDNSIGWYSENFSVSELTRLIEQTSNIDTSTYREQCRKVSEKYKWQHQEKVLLEIYQSMVE